MNPGNTKDAIVESGKYINHYPDYFGGTIVVAGSRTIATTQTK